MLDLSTDPHQKAKSSFKNGYITYLEELIGKVIPSHGLKASPHIDYRLKTLFGKFKSICEMLGNSGSNGMMIEK